MRILICCNAYPPRFIGGAELVAHHQGKALVATGHEVQVFTGDIEEVGQRHSIRSQLFDGVLVHRVSLVGQDYDPKSINFCHPLVEEHFLQLLNSFQPDIVHFHNIIGLSVKIVSLAKEFGSKTVLTLHDHWGFCFKNTLMKSEGVACTDYAKCAECLPLIHGEGGCPIPMQFRQDYFSLWLRDIDIFVSPSHYLADAYIRAGFPADRMHVVWNGIDLDKFANLTKTPDPQHIRFSFFGTFSRHKGVHVLLEALPLLRNRKMATVNLIGDGDQLAAYRRQLKDNGCGDLARFWGKVDNNHIAQAFAETDVLVLPSIWRENQPVSITEAMACRIPVIASQGGGLPELVQDGLTGYLVEPGNARDLAQRMDELMADPQRIEAMGNKAQDMMMGNSYAQQVGKLLKLYESGDSAPIESGHSRPLVICIGTTTEDVFRQVIHLLSFYSPSLSPLFVMAEWLTEAQIGNASLIWVVGQVDPWSALALAEKHALPLLVPDSAELLSAQCRLRNGGLAYADSHEAAACTAYLLTHDGDRRALGRQIAESSWSQHKAPPENGSNIASASA